MPSTLPVAPEVLDRARKIKLFLMDVDGTLTDGSVNLISLPNDGGVAEMKAFNSQDGAGLKLAHIMGIRTGFITGRKSPAVSQRAHELGVEFVYLGQAMKSACRRPAYSQMRSPIWATTCRICRWPSAPAWQSPWQTPPRSLRQ
jgi:3-deoxy-D-manno-octulosonate 8-phosphate phosphatase (KDO 8-P phosphatase)